MVSWALRADRPGVYNRAAMRSSQYSTVLRWWARSVFYLGVIIVLAGCAFGYEGDYEAEDTTTAKRVGEDQGINLLSFSDGKGGGQRGSTTFDVDDPEYQEYLRWKEWQEFKHYEEWKRQQQPGDAESAPPTPSE